MLAAIRLPVVTFAYVVAQLRRVPGFRWIQRHTALVVTALLIGALVVLVVWGAQRSVRRISLPELAYGQLEAMQSWIIISGELGSESVVGNDYRYRLTDPAVANAELTVVSSVRLPLGQTTVSGTYLGPREALVPGFRWIGQMHADTELAREQEPPWITIGLTGLAALLALASRTSYPLFLGGARPIADARVATLHVDVQRGPRTEAGEVVPATLVARADAPAELRIPGSEPVPLLLHSPHTSVEIGDLHRLSGAQPALVMHTAADELTIGFAAKSDRDAAYAALTRWTHP